MSRPDPHAEDLIDEILRKGATANAKPNAKPLEGSAFIVVDNDVRATADDALARLPQYVDAIYTRNGVLADVVRVPSTEKEARERTGAPRIRPLPLVTLLEYLSTLPGWVKPDARTKSGFRVVTPPSDVVQAIHRRGEWPTLRPLVGLLEAPSMRADGSIIQEPNTYDAKTGYLYLPSVEFPRVPALPTREDAGRALKALEDVFHDFPFAARHHAMVPIAALLTILARPSIEGSVPAFGVDASTRGTGKTLSTDVVSVIASGRTTAKLSFPEKDDELEKILGGLAIEGASVVDFDNVTRVFGGGPLDRVLTARDEVKLRILGRSETPSLRWRATLLFTGNNLVFAGDTTRRVLVARLESDLERPEDRSGFVHDPLLPWVREHRAQLVVDALTILRAHALCGRPREGCRVWGSFEEWSAIVPPAIVFAGGADPMLARVARDGVDDTETTALRVILSEWPRLSEDGITARAAIDALYPQGREQRTAPDGFDDLRESIESIVPTGQGRPPSSTRLGSQLRKFRGRVVGGQRLEGKPDRRGVIVWAVRPAGDAGDAGDVLNRESWNCEGANSGAGSVEVPRQAPHPQHSVDDYDSAERAAIQSEALQ